MFEPDCGAFLSQGPEYRSINDIKLPHASLCKTAAWYFEILGTFIYCPSCLLAASEGSVRPQHNYDGTNRKGCAEIPRRIEFRFASMVTD